MSDHSLIYRARQGYHRRREKYREGIEDEREPHDPESRADSAGDHSRDERDRDELEIFCTAGIAPDYPVDPEKCREQAIDRHCDEYFDRYVRNPVADAVVDEDREMHCQKRAENDRKIDQLKDHDTMQRFFNVELFETDIHIFPL